MIGNKLSKELSFQLNSEELKRSIEYTRADFKSAATPSDLVSLVKLIDEAVSTLDNNLFSYTTINKKRLQQDITTIEALRTSKLASTIDASANLSNVFSTANDLGFNLTYKIKSLDEEIGNVNKTLKYVKDVQLLKSNISQIYYAIEHGNWESAAQCIYIINTKIPKELILGQYASVMIPSTDIPELPQNSIAKWTDQLAEVFKSQFTEAAKARDVERLTKFFQLFPLISQEEIGLTCYANFICEIINESSKNLTSTVNNIHASELKPGIFSTVTMQLFENVSMMLSQHGPLIKRHYSLTYPDALPFVIRKIQKEIDLQIGIIADTFYDARRLDKVFQDVDLYTFPVLSKRMSDTMLEHEAGLEKQRPYDETITDEILPIKSIGDLILELSSIIQSWSLYCKFVTIKYFDTRQTPQSELQVPELILNSHFTKKVKEKLLPSFKKLYDFYFRRSLEKCIVIEEMPSLESYLHANQHQLSKSPDQVPCSSVVEDLTLILNNTLRNVLLSGNLLSVKDFATGSFKVLQQDVINGFFIKNLNDNLPKYNQLLTLITDDHIKRVTELGGVGQGGTTTSPRATSRSGTPEPNSSFFKGASSALGSVVSGSGAIVGSLQANASASGNSPRLINFIIYLNSIGVAQEYFSKIIQKIIGDPKQVGFVRSNLPFNRDSENAERILRQEFLEPFNTITGKVLNESVINLYNQSIKQKLFILIGELVTDTSNANYILYSSNQINDLSVLIKFKSNWASLTKPYLQTLHVSIWNKLLRLIIVNLANLIERKLHSALRKFQINDMGAIKLEKDLSFVINEVCQDNYHLREKFIRLTQFVLLVGMDDEEYEESNQPALRVGNEGTPMEGEENEAEDIGGINWVLTPHERNQIRQYRV